MHQSGTLFNLAAFATGLASLSFSACRKAPSAPDDVVGVTSAPTLKLEQQTEREKGVRYPIRLDIKNRSGIIPITLTHELELTAERELVGYFAKGEYRIEVTSNAVGFVQTLSLPQTGSAAPIKGPEGNLMYPIYLEHCGPGPAAVRVSWTASEDEGVLGEFPKGEYKILVGSFEAAVRIPWTGSSEPAGQ